VFTRCTACHTVHPVNAALLASGAGRFRCGKCNQVGNALEALFDEWPDAGDKPPARGAVPELGLDLDLKSAAEARPYADGAAPGGDDSAGPARAKWLIRASWITLAVITVCAAVYLYAEFTDRPLLQQPGIRNTLIGFGLVDEAPSRPYRNLSFIHVVSRELKSHPSRPGMLQLSATIVNRAARTQPYPELEVLLLNSGGRVLARARYRPRDYLARGIPPGSGMTPQAYLPFVLDLPDPGDRAVGFEINFH